MTQSHCSAELRTQIGRTSLTLQKA